MSDASQQAAIESLRDWSKWLVGLDVAGLAGCILKEHASGGLAGATFELYVTAMLLFLAALFTSTVLLMRVPKLMQRKPIEDDALAQRIFGPFSVWTLARTQFVLFWLGMAAFLLWVLFAASNRVA